MEEKYDIYPIKNSDEDIEDNLYNNKNNSFDNDLNNIINLNNSCNIPPNHNYFKTFINNNNDNDNDNDNNNNNKIIDIKNKKKNYRNILVKNIKTSDKRLFIHINYIFSFSNKINRNNKIYDINTLVIKRNIFFSLIKDNYDNKHQKNILSKNKFFPKANYRNYNYYLEKENEKINKTNYTKNNKDKYLFSCVKFIIKIINKIFLKKNYFYFKNAFEEKYYKNKKNNGNNKLKINTYKKKISKNKI